MTDPLQLRIPEHSKRTEIMTNLFIIRPMIPVKIWMRLASSSTLLRTGKEIIKKNTIKHSTARIGIVNRRLRVPDIIQKWRGTLSLKKTDPAKRTRLGVLGLKDLK